MGEFVRKSSPTFFDGNQRQILETEGRGAMDYRRRSRMKKSLITFLFGLTFLYLISTSVSFCQEEEIDIEELKKKAPKVFIDCPICDIDYTRTEITFVNYVRDRKEADIHVLVTSLRTGAGGREYTIAFIGQNKFEGINDTHKYFTDQTDTQDEIREGMVKAMKVGLMSYVAKTPIASRIEISYRGEIKPAEVKDKWNYWVFRLSGRGYIRGEESLKYRSLNGSLSASRVTEKLKIQLSASVYHYKEDFTYEDEVIESTRDSWYLNGLFVKSLNDHWSVGFFIAAESSSYENIEFSLVPQPAIEYNLFPYSESTRRQLRFLYRIGFNSVRYREETIYDKMSENLWSESLSITFDVREKWGTISTTLAGSHYFHDFSKYHLTLFNILSLRLFKGLNFFVIGSGSRIHDQLSLVKGETSLEEVLLRRRELETGYDYFFSIGLSFTFGSIFTNVVNPRFGSRGYSGMSVIID
jgi:hypothetical protein